MGGENEAFVAKKAAEPAIVKGTTKQSIRIHLNSGEVHFHDDEQRRGESTHGRNFAKIYLSLVSEFLSKDKGTILKEAFKTKNVAF